MKSAKSLYGPRASRSSMIFFEAASPTPLMPAMPKRMRSPTGAKVSKLSLTSGPSTSMPMASASSMKCATFSALPISLVSTAAMNCTG
ncbi:MAG: hypothetical protein BWX86_01761 [Verrucomicrobia bacterium ADurb.Bin122]|nr:MAG: hypothetical protein BWX86_01761 [Verrucomicrobia bacterium ADurb.Bin122]